MCSVYDYNIIKRDAFMGRGTMSLKEVMMGKVTDACVQLHDIKGKGELGQVYLSFALDGTLSPGMSLDFGRGSMAMRRGAFAVWRGRAGLMRVTSRVLYCFRWLILTLWLFLSLQLLLRKYERN